MNENTLITVVVPTYNNEKYLPASITSILEQTYKSIEILLIDDGSTDSSGKICDEFAKKDERIRVIHKLNGGVSAARNTALLFMTGDYVTFVDGDDTIAPTYIEDLYTAIKKTGADMSTCGYYKIFPDSEKKCFFKREAPVDDLVCLSGLDSIKEMFYGSMCSASAGNKLYARRLFDKKFNFPTDLIMGEDTYFAYRCMLQAKKIVHTNKQDYFYLQHGSSVSNKKENMIKFYDYVKLYDAIMRTDGNLANKDYRAAIVNRLVENNFWVLMKLVNDTVGHRDEVEHIKENIKRYRKECISNNRCEPRVRAACSLSYLGFDTLFTVYDIMNKKQGPK